MKTKEILIDLVIGIGSIFGLITIICLSPIIFVVSMLDNTEYEECYDE